MARMDRTKPQPTLCELLQMVFEGAAWPVMSVEHVLDRLSDPPGRDPAPGRSHATTEETRK